MGSWGTAGVSTVAEEAAGRASVGQKAAKTFSSGPALFLKVPFADFRRDPRVWKEYAIISLSASFRASRLSNAA